jgi:hypothetical protein
MIVGSGFSDRQRHTKAWHILSEIPNLASYCQLVDLTVDGVASSATGEARCRKPMGLVSTLDSRLPKWLGSGRCLSGSRLLLICQADLQSWLGMAATQTGTTVRGINFASFLFTSATDPAFGSIPLITPKTSSSAVFCPGVGSSPWK